MYVTQNLHSDLLMQINQTRKHVDRCFNHTAQAIEELKRGQSNGSTNTSNVKGINKTGWFKRKKLLSLATTILQTLKSFLKAVGQIAMQSYEEDCFCKMKIKIEWMSEFIYNAHWPWVIPQRTIYFLRASISFWQHDVSTKKVDSTFLRKQNPICHCLSLPILVYRVCFELNFSYSLFKYNSWL